MPAWRVEVEHVAGRQGWIHPADRRREVLTVRIPQTLPYMAEYVVPRLPQVQRCMSNPNFRSRIRSIQPAEEKENA